MKITEKSDVYSYGIVVLEVLTGKQPIDPTIPDGLHIVDWVRQKRGGSEVLDPGLCARSEPEIEEMLQTLGVALLCVNPSPEDRPTMKDVAAMLKEIRQEREEYMKVNVLLHGSCANEEDNNNYNNNNNNSSTNNNQSSEEARGNMMKQSYPVNSNSTGFSATLLVSPSSSNAQVTLNSQEQSCG